MEYQKYRQFLQSPGDNQNVEKCWSFIAQKQLI
jgi:hypothetical protein